MAVVDVFEPAFTKEDSSMYPLLTKYASKDLLERSDDRHVERQLFKDAVQTLTADDRPTSKMQAATGLNRSQTGFAGRRMEVDRGRQAFKEDADLQSTASTRKGKKLVPLIGLSQEMTQPPVGKRPSEIEASHRVGEAGDMKDSYLLRVVNKVTSSANPYDRP